MTAVLVILLLAASGMSGCTSAPEQRLPDSNVPAAQNSGAEQLPNAPPEPQPEAWHHRDEGDFKVDWATPTDRYHQQYFGALANARTFENTTALLNLLLVLPYDLWIGHRECGVANAFYNPADRRITLCYELLELIAQMFEDPSYDAEQYGAVVISAWLFIFFHELGHGLVDAYDVPVTGREEDAVDDLATLIWIDLGVPEVALNAAFFWYLLDDGEYTNADFADEHSLDRQRFFSIMCVVYGSAPQEFSWLVRDGHLPPERADRCPYEYEQKDAAWTRLLEPWFQKEAPSVSIGTIDTPTDFPRPRPPPSPPPPQTQYLASGKTIAVPAESVFHHAIVLQRTSVISYAFEVIDSSSLDVGVIRNADLSRYENGESVDTWAYHADVQRIRNEVTLAPEVYELVFLCLNSYFDCDLQYTLAVTA